MKNDGISYGPLVEQLVLLVLATAGLGAILASGFYIFSILFVPLVGLCIYRIIRRYGESIRRVTFMFNAIDNDDLTFRFRDDEAEADNRMLNTALNRIKEIIVRAKLRAEERERYYQLIMECARTGLVTVNDAGSVYQANGEALRIFGLPRMTHIRQTETSMPEACRALQEIRTGQRLHVKEMTEAGEVNLSLTCAEIMLDQKRLRVIAVSDIDDYLAQTQIESWSKLTRILTHEIMNSLAPITSLSDTLLHLGRPLDTDVAQGLETISATSRRLPAFVATFRRFTRIPEPQKAPVEVRGLLERAAALVATPQVGITVDVQPAEMLVYADEGLVSQVVVNLLKNAREAVAAQPDARIDVRARIDEGENIRIDVTDNGKAIPAAVTENIFTPFFTTKADGSGIGLSVSRRIMQLHNGSLRLTSNTDRRVTFTLLFE